MRCISPILVRANGRRDFVPCGKCNFCLQTKRADWSFRLSQELKVSSAAHFLTITYSDELVPRSDEGLQQVRKSDLQLFLKRLRKASGDRLRYYACAEYGTKTFRPHYHMILFNASSKLINNVQSIWKAGHIHVGSVTEASINYVTKYVINRVNDDVYAGREPPFSIMSKRPGIGSNYVQTHAGWHKDDMRNYTQVKGEKRRLPRYLKDKIFTKLERKMMNGIDNHKVVTKMTDDYWNEVERLSKLHHDPESYIVERENWHYESIHSKLNELNKF